jgi:outer membrane receptor protein involved in Fe transport
MDRWTGFEVGGPVPDPATMKGRDEMFNKWKVGTVLLVLGLLFSLNSFAQETTGGFTGSVLDPSGAAVPKAKVEITGGTLAQGLAVITDETGSYTLAQLPAGTYDLTVTAQGFTVVKMTAVSVILGKTSRVDFKLNVSQTSEVVTVSGDAVMVDTASSSTAISVEKTFFDNMPKARNFADLINVAPGVRSEGKSGQYQVDGASGSENTFYLDGMEVTNIQTGRLGTTSQIPVEMVEQVQIKNGVMDAQYGGAMGGVINAVVKSGSNAFHGQAGFYYNNDAMQARYRPGLRLNPDNEDASQYTQYPVDNYSTWNPVFNIGGPLWKNKVFFFAGYMPTQTNTTRDVYFTDGTQQSFSNHTFQHYSVAKIDYVPWSKLHTNFSWIYSPSYTQGYLPARGTSEYPSTDDPGAPWANEGNYGSSNTFMGAADYLATSKLIFSFRGGYKGQNYNTNYGLPSYTAIYYSGQSTTLPPAELRASNGWVQSPTALTIFDIYKRENYNADMTYLANWHGQHNLKVGWSMNRLSNDVASSSYANGYYRYYWGLSYACVTSQCSGRNKGAYGYYRYRQLGTYGYASSNNQGIFFQDSWRVNGRLTLNLGLRTEREYLPSFATAGSTAAPPIKFSWGDKISPRLGFAYDLNGNGKSRLYASFGQFYDVMKYEMPRGSFGGDVWKEWYYSLEDPNVVNSNSGPPADPYKMPGTFYEMVNWRIPSNDPEAHLIEPDLKPVKQQMFDVGYDYSINSNTALTLRYTNRRIIRTIEDSGYMGVDGETYIIANPGEGITGDPAKWAEMWEGNTGVATLVKPKRQYDAVEARFDKRFAKNYQFVASYTWSRLYGNYSGLASSDENGRESPNVNRYYDMPWVYITQRGALAEGRLATDRPHTFKFFGSYLLKSKLGNTTFSPIVNLFSGTPLTTEVSVISSTNAMPYGRADLGRSPFYSNFDLNLAHDFKPMPSHESVRVRLELAIFNLFNQSTILDRFKQIEHESDGHLQFDDYADPFKGWDTRALMQEQGMRQDPRYGLTNSFQGPRSLRLQVSFIF